MHRAGTSMLTRILQQSGVFVGNDLDSNNESQFFCNLNDWAFYQAGASWDNPYNMQFLTDDFIAEIVNNFQTHIKTKRLNKYIKNFSKIVNSNQLWGWKDPRNTFTLEIWRKIFPDAKIIHIYRNPIDVAESLRKREQIFQKAKGTQTKTGVKKMIKEYKLIKERLYSQSLRVNSIQEGVKLWADYTSKALSVSENCLHLSYENLLENTGKELVNVYEFIEIDNNKFFETILAGINKSRKTAFINNEKLVEEYRKIKNLELVKNLKYDNLI